LKIVLNAGISTLTIKEELLAEKSEDAEKGECNMALGIGVCRPYQRSRQMISPRVMKNHFGR